MSETVRETACRISDMTIRGAGRIARAGASAMGKFAEEYEGGSLEDFLRDLEAASQVLISSRPTAVSLWNGVRASMKGAADAPDLGSAKSIVSGNARRFVESSLSAAETIAKIGAKRIMSGDTVMTHCNSSIAIGVIKEAHRQGKEIKVYATESRPWRQGLLTVRELSEAGIDTTLIIDSAVRSVMKRTDKVFVGADTITSAGVLINKIGTSHLALAAHEARVPFYVCAETYKFSPMTMFGDTLQMLVENAVEHGISGSKDLRGTVRIRSFEEDGFHVVEVEDNGAGIPLEKPVGSEEDQRLHVGLRNVEQRLERMCQGTLTIRSLEGKGTVAVIRIPE